MSGPSRSGDAPRERTSVRVRIVGEEYALRSDAPEEHTRAVAAYVDRVISQVMASGHVVESHKAAILAALEIADELLRARAAENALTDRLMALTHEVGRWLPPAKRGGGPE